MFNNRLDSLPPEIIYMVFDYLPAHEILKAFSNLNSAFNKTLSTYPSYRFDFKSISRSDFDLVCNRIMPHQVISLTLSDMEDTPGQSELFFSRFQLTDFRQIQTLKLINIEYVSWENIYLHLNQIENYHQFSIELIDNDRVPDARVLAHASQIKIHTTNQLQTHSLPYLRSLTMAESSMHELQSICLSADHLTSIKVNYLMFHPHDDLVLPARQLIRLTLYFNQVPVFMHQMERLLMNLPRLKYFEVSVTKSIDLADGQAWKRLTQQLVTFHFNFWGQTDWTKTMLDSFRTPYWTDEKEWFIAYTSRCLFSVPYFSPNSTNTSFQPPLYSTVPDKAIFYDKINRFILNSTQKIPHGYFHHVKTLEFQSLPSSKNLSTFINLNHVENFIVSSSINYSTILYLMKLMPAVRRFSINTELIDFVEEAKYSHFEQIRILDVNVSSVNWNFYIIEQLVRIFPKVEVLRVESIPWKLGIAHFLERFENLSSASFSRLHPQNEQIDTETSMIEFILDETECFKRGSFICRRRTCLRSNQQQEAFFDFWINKQELGSLENWHWIPKPEIGNPTRQWQTAFIQILFWFVINMTLIYMKYPFVSKSIHLLVMISDYMIDFWYHFYCFLSNPLQLTFGNGTGYLLIYFYLLFCLYLCIIITLFSLNSFFRSFNNWKILIIYYLGIIPIFLILKNLFFLIMFLLKSRIR